MIYFDACYVWLSRWRTDGDGWLIVAYCQIEDEKRPLPSPLLYIMFSSSRSPCKTVSPRSTAMWALPCFEGENTGTCNYAPGQTVTMPDCLAEVPETIPEPGELFVWPTFSFSVSLAVYMSPCHPRHRVFPNGGAVYSVCVIIIMIRNYLCYRVTGLKTVPLIFAI